MILVKIVLKLAFFLALLLCFMSLYQHGPGGFLPGLRGEAEWVAGFFARDAARADNPTASD